MTLHPTLHPTVQAALDALSSGDRAAWQSLFAPGALLFDDGHPHSLADFTQSAVGRERFTEIERVDNGGCDVYGRFHSDQWGDFRVYFRFELTAEDKISRLEIGQA